MNKMTTDCTVYKKDVPPEKGSILRVSHQIAEKYFRPSSSDQAVRRPMKLQLDRAVNKRKQKVFSPPKNNN
jgi:hypothetical protein